MNDFYLVEQWGWNIYGVGSGYEYYIGKIEIDFDVVVLKGIVLFRIKYFEQGGRWVVMEILVEFIYFVEQEKWIVYFGFGQVLQDFVWY